MTTSVELATLPHIRWSRTVTRGYITEAVVCGMLKVNFSQQSAGKTVEADDHKY